MNGRHELDVEDENSIEGGTSKVDYVLLVGDKKLALCEAKSPSVMRKVGEGLPERGFKLDWVRGQVLIPKILTKVSTRSPISYNTGFKKICTGRFVSRSETHGMAVSHLP